MPFLFIERSHTLERMDVEDLDAATMGRVLRELELINRYIGGARATLLHLSRMAQHWRPGESIQLVDWGTGGADIPRAIIRWARKRGFLLHVIGVESNPVAVAYAREACRDYPEIQIEQADIFQWQTPEGSFDYAMSSLCLHHLDDAQIIELLKKSDRVSRRGILMNDLIRSRRAWLWIWALTRVLPAHPIVRADGPLSVKRAFLRRDLDAFIEQSNLPYLKAHQQFGYRWMVCGEKPTAKEGRR